MQPQESSIVLYTKTDGSLKYLNPWDDKEKYSYEGPWPSNKFSLSVYLLPMLRVTIEVLYTWTDPVSFIMYYVKTDGSLWGVGHFEDGYKDNAIIYGLSPRTLYKLGNDLSGEIIKNLPVFCGVKLPHMIALDIDLMDMNKTFSI